MQRKGDNGSRTVSDLALCIQSIVNDGRAAVSPQMSTIDDSDALPMLRELDRCIRDELALEVPAFSPTVALWAARLFHQLCRCVVCRDIPEEEINKICSIPCPEPHSPETDWSADLTLHYLPNLFQLARHLSSADPLVVQIKKIAAEWPLSSVGIAGLGRPGVDTFIKHSALRRVYADRILATADASRVGDSRVDDLLRADIGIYRDMAPEIASKLFEPIHDTH
jgi:hypothetical protein